MDIELHWRALCENLDGFIENRNQMVPIDLFHMCSDPHGEAEVRLFFFKFTSELFKELIMSGAELSKTAEMLIGFISPEEDTTCTLRFPGKDIEISIFLSKEKATRVIENAYINLLSTVVSVVQ